MTALGPRRKICVVTGTRADYGLLEPIMALLQNAPDFQLQIVVTGMHLSPEFGSTWREIKADGYHIDERVETLLSSDSPVGIAKSIGLGVIGMADALARLQPDLVLLLGDRFEILAAAQAALAARVPLGHIAGGDVTEGALDDSMRHAISKMAHLHFATNEEAARRLVRMGEQPWRVHVTGSPGIDKLLSTPLLEREAIEAELGITLRQRIVLATFHPATVHSGQATRDFDEILAALDATAHDTTIVITGTNADQEGRALLERMKEYASRDPSRIVATVSLGSRNFLSLLKHASVVVGNSSSGLYEAPSFGVPTVNVGDRQQGRLRAASVVDVGTDRSEIARALQNAFEGRIPTGSNPYGDGKASERLLAALRAETNFRALLSKRFYEEVADAEHA